MALKKFKPTIALLNPPYSKENGHKELEFVWDEVSSHGKFTLVFVKFF
jgi:hypothetical protein